MRAVLQTEVYAGIVFYIPPQFQAVLHAMSNFQINNKDPKATISGFLIMAGGQLFLSLYCIYDAPIAPDGIFNQFLAIFHTFSSLQTKSYFSFIQSTANSALPR